MGEKVLNVGYALLIISLIFLYLLSGWLQDLPKNKAKELAKIQFNCAKPKLIKKYRYNKYIELKVCNKRVIYDCGIISSCRRVK